MLKKIIVILIILFIPLMAFSQMTVKIKDISKISGIRDNQLIGYGLIVGVNGKGDSSKCKITKDTAANLFRKFNVRIEPEDIISKNIAAVIVTANLPSFAGVGSRIDVKVSSVGDAVSIENGELLQTALKGADGNIYAVVQGTVVTVYRDKNDMFGRMTVGYIPNGGLIEKETSTVFINNNIFSLSLDQDDFTTVKNTIEAINAQFNKPLASSINNSTIDINIPQEFKDKIPQYISQIGEIEIEPGNIARVVIDRRSGTIVMGGDVKVSAVAISQKSLNIEIGATPPMLQERGAKNQQKNSFVLEEGTDVNTIVDGLNKMGAKTDDIISIMRALKTAGALFAELIIL